MKQIFKFIYLKKKELEYFIGKLIPPLGYIFKKRDAFLEYLDKEDLLFIEKMPKWYRYCETSWTMRCVRVLMGLWLISQTDILQETILYFFETHLAFTEIEKKYWFIFSLFINCVCIFYFLFFSSLKLILGFIFFRELTSNSPISWQKCVGWGISRLCRAGFWLGVFGLGGNVVDIRFKDSGYVPPFRGYFLNSHFYVTDGFITPYGASEASKDLILVPDNMPGAKIIQGAQNHTLQVEAEHHKIYNER